MQGNILVEEECIPRAHVEGLEGRPFPVGGRSLPEEGRPLPVRGRTLLVGGWPLPVGSTLLLVWGWPLHVGGMLPFVRLRCA